VRRELRALGDDGRVDVQDLARAEQRDDVAQQRERVGAGVRGVGVREVLPMSPSPAAPSSASMTAWVRTSASEWPASPRSCSMRTPPRTSARPASSRCES
jgi:hypothetical protein